MSNKIHFKIDGKNCEAEAGQNLVNAAKVNGIFIPSLCYFEHIDPPLGTCRVCTVKINGKPMAGCMVEVKEGMEYEVNAPELVDNRKAMVEMMFAEGNHFCPSCPKSGDCDMQRLGYETGISSTRFPHLFVDRVVDFNPRRIVVDHNRCILCKRCVEEVLTDEGEQIFAFHNRGNSTVVMVDYEKEARLSKLQAERAMQICPVGAILARGKILGRPFGDRKYDLAPDSKKVPLGNIPPDSVKTGKKIIATTSLAGCFGCHMSMLDIDLGLLDLIELVEFNKSPLTDIKNFTKRCDIGLIEGGCCNDENVEVLRKFRENCDILVAVGECSIWGGLPAMRNMVPLEECLIESYLGSVTSAAGANIVPASIDLPKILDKVYSCDEIVKIDYYIPGCPPSAEHIWKTVKNLLFGEDYSILYSEFKYD